MRVLILCPLLLVLAGCASPWTALGWPDQPEQGPALGSPALPQHLPPAAAILPPIPPPPPPAVPEAIAASGEVVACSHPSAVAAGDDTLERVQRELERMRALVRSLQASSPQMPRSAD